ncbi:MAG: AzlC family ABC transporter permease, partial [Ardenticatenaceae bacterium]
MNRPEREKTDTSAKDHPSGGILLTILPIAAAIAVFGTFFGAAAAPLLGTRLTILASALIFSGAVQLTLVGLLLTGATVPALLAATVVLNLRNLLLGAVLRPHITSSKLRRAGLAWFVIDETVGLALANPARAPRTLLIGGLICYVAWLIGTILGIGVGALGELRSLATAMFPVLFIGLAAIAATRRDLLLRAVAAAALTILLSVFMPSARGLAPVVAAIVVALPG